MTKRIIYTKQAPEPIGPYNQAIEVNNTLYVSGQIPVNPITGEVEKKDIEWQTEQVMLNLHAILVEADYDFCDVVKCSIFVTDIDNFKKVNKAYAIFFENGTEPCRECVEVSKLPKNVQIEISCIAIK